MTGFLVDIRSWLRSRATRRSRDRAGALDAPYDSRNIFARILRGDAPCLKVYETDHVLAFLDTAPRAPGHSLVIPKSAAVNLLDADPAAAAEVWVAAQRVAAAVRTTLNPDGVEIFQLSGRAAGQSVFHLHVHIVPVWSAGRIPPAPRRATAVLAAMLAAAVSSE